MLFDNDSEKNYYYSRIIALIFQIPYLQWDTVEKCQNEFAHQLIAYITIWSSAILVEVGLIGKLGHEHDNKT